MADTEHNIKQEEQRGRKRNRLGADFQLDKHPSKADNALEMHLK